MDPFDLSQWGFSGLSFPELLSFQDHLPSDGDKDNHLLATPKRVSTPDCVSANLSSSPIPVEVPVVSAQEEPLVPLDLSRPSAARTCSEGLKEPSQSVASNKPLLVPDYPEIRLPRPFSSYNQLSSIPFFFFICAPSHYFPGEAAQLLKETRISVRLHLQNYERRFIPDGYLEITKEEAVTFPDGWTDPDIISSTPGARSREPKSPSTPSHRQTLKEHCLEIYWTVKWISGSWNVLNYCGKLWCV